MSQMPQLQQAVRDLEGIVRASVRWPDPLGPAELHVEFEVDADRAAVTREVLGVLRDVGGVDLDTLEVVSPVPSPAEAQDQPRAQEPTAQAHAAPQADAAPRARAAPQAPAAPRSAARPVFSNLTVDRHDLDASVQVTLRSAEETWTGRAEGLATAQATLRSAALATLEALRTILEPDARLSLEWIEVLQSPGPGRPQVVQTAVGHLSRKGEEVFVGSALGRWNLQEAAVRAVLNALNRRIDQVVHLP